MLIKISRFFSGWPEVIRVPDKRSSIVEQILRVIISRNEVPNGI